MKKYDLTKFKDRLFAYYAIMSHYEAEDYRYRTNELLNDIKRSRAYLSDFRWSLEYSVNGKTPKGDPSYMTWREIPFHLHKIKECRGCGRPFYDVSRNGRLTFCHWLPYKRYNYWQDAYKSTERDGVPISFCQMRHDSGRHEQKRTRRGFYAGTEND